MNFKSIALVTSLAVAGISALAHAAIFNVGGTDYDITTIVTSYNANTALLQSQP